MEDSGVDTGAESNRVLEPDEIVTDILMVQESFSNFTATGEVGHLDDAVLLAKVLLSDLLEMRRAQPAPTDELEQAITRAREAVAETQLDHPGRGRILIRLGISLNNKYARSGALEYLEQAIEWAREAVEATPLDHPDRAHILSQLSIFLYNRYAHVGTREDLEEPIERAEEAVEATSQDDPERASRLKNLTLFLQGRYDRFGALEDLEKVIKHNEDALAAIQPGHPSRSSILNNLGNFLQARYSQLGTLEDLETGIERVGEAAAATPPDHPARASILQNLSDSFHVRYSRFGAAEDLDQAIKWAEEVLELTPPNHSDRANRLQSLGIYFYSKFTRFGALDDLEQAIKRAEEATVATPRGHPDRASILHSLASVLQARYARLGNLEDFEQAMVWAEEAEAATPPDHPDRAKRLQGLGSLLHSKFTRLGALGDLVRAIEFAEGAVEATPLGHPDRIHRLSNLGTFIQSRYARLGTIADLERIVKLAEEALEAMPPDRDHVDLTGILYSLGTSLHRRYNRFGALEDLEKAIKLVGEAVEATPADNPTRARMLHNLGVYLGDRYKRSGAPEDLERAIIRAEESLEATSEDRSHPDWPDRLSRLGNALYSRYQRFGALEDLEQAITRANNALAATPSDHPDRVGRLNNLGDFLEDRYARLGALEDLEQAIKHAEAAVAATPLDHPDRAGRLGNLGIRFHLKYERFRNLGDLEKATKLAEQALEATPPEPSHPERPARLNNLGNALKDRYALLRTPQDRQQAIKQAEAAVAATPPNHLDRAGILANLGKELLLTGSSKDIDRGIDISIKAWQSDLSPPRYRIRGARSAAIGLGFRKRWQEAAFLLEEAVKMLTKVSPRFLGRDDQEHMLSVFTILAADAVSVALQAGAEASHCLRLLELGRGIIMGLAIDCRSDLSELEMESPDLFERFNRLRIEIDSPLLVEGQSTEQYRSHRVQTIRRMDETLAIIRKLPGFGGFQLPPSSEDLMAKAAEGPIVILNSTLLRSDAIIVTDSVIKALALPKLVHEEANHWMRQTGALARGKRSTYPARNKKMADLLLWLWDVAVEPVLMELQLGADNRIWWIGVGQLATAPFHAAGDHSPGSTRNTLSHAISSYIPTIKALSYAREKEIELFSGDSRLLLVTMPTTPGHRSLKDAAQEIDDIASIVGDRTTRLDHPSAAKVLEKLPLYHAIHFACHAVSDSNNPSNSHLLLLNDDDSGAVDRLTVGAVSNVNIKNAQLAYLSACCTADNASLVLADESIYIASGFQLAGFSHVLATLWESNDVACRQVSGDFYRQLFDGRGNGGHRKVSAAFHHAVMRLRDQNPSQPLKWAPFIHTGA